MEGDGFAIRRPGRERRLAIIYNAMPIASIQIHHLQSPWPGIEDHLPSIWRERRLTGQLHQHPMPASVRIDEFNAVILAEGFGDSIG
jgi:hypothetical protein